MRRWTVLLVMLFAAGCASLKMPGCSTLKPQVCALIEKGIAAIDAKLNPDDVMSGEIAPILKAKGLSDIMDQVKEYWDNMSTEDKLAAGRSILIWLRDNWCGGPAGERKTGFL